MEKLTRCARHWSGAEREREREEEEDRGRKRYILRL
jgi:hypothetical protein